MTFEEFFKKKRIDLVALRATEPSLFSEFGTHFDQMGEKSFDHTKKYWFNKLRRAFPLAPELKTEKVHLANPLAEQTVTESLIETGITSPQPKAGFVPRFKAGNMAKSADKVPEQKDDGQPSENPEPHVPSGDSPAKPAYQPRFKMKPKVEDTGSTPAEQTIKTNISPGKDQQSEQASPELSPKPGYQPRFKMKPKVEDTGSAPSVPLTEAENNPGEENEAPVKETPAELPGDAPAKPAYKPRFNMKNIKPKDAE